MAAAAVMLVIPAYVYDDHALHEVVVLGELLAVAVLVDVPRLRDGRHRPARPLLAPHARASGASTGRCRCCRGTSSSSTDTSSLNFYITTYLLFAKFRGKKPTRKKYVPFVFLAIGWAVSIHTVTAFLYSGMGARPHWNAAILAPRFLVSAFAAGPSLVIIALSMVRDRMGLPGQGRGARTACGRSSP